MTLQPPVTFPTMRRQPQNPKVASSTTSNAPISSISLILRPVRREWYCYLDQRRKMEQGYAEARVKNLYCPLLSICSLPMHSLSHQTSPPTYSDDRDGWLPSNDFLPLFPVFLLPHEAREISRRKEPTTGDTLRRWTVREGSSVVTRLDRITTEKTKSPPLWKKVFEHEQSRGHLWNSVMQANHEQDHLGHHLASK